MMIDELYDLMEAHINANLLLLRASKFRGGVHVDPATLPPGVKQLNAYFKTHGTRTALTAIALQWLNAEVAAADTALKTPVVQAVPGLDNPYAGAAVGANTTVRQQLATISNAPVLLTSGHTTRITVSNLLRLVARNTQPVQDVKDARYKNGSIKYNAKTGQPKLATKTRYVPNDRLRTLLNTVPAFDFQGVGKDKTWVANAQGLTINQLMAKHYPDTVEKWGYSDKGFLSNQFTSVVSFLTKHNNGLNANDPNNELTQSDLAYINAQSYNAEHQQVIRESTAISQLSGSVTHALKAQAVAIKLNKPRQARTRNAGGVKKSNGKTLRGVQHEFFFPQGGLYQQQQAAPAQQFFQQPQQGLI